MKIEWTPELAKKARAELLAEIERLKDEVYCLSVENEALVNLLYKKWRPIETAPKNGERIIVGYGRQSGFPVKVVRFNTTHNHWMHYGDADIWVERDATHWMPLPPTP